MRCLCVLITVTTLATHAQTGGANGVGKPVEIDVGSFAAGGCKRACFSRTEYDGKQWSHAHPYLTADNKWLIFSARRNEHAQVYGAKLKDGWLQTLDEGTS